MKITSEFLLLCFNCCCIVVYGFPEDKIEFVHAASQISIGGSFPGIELTCSGDFGCHCNRSRPCNETKNFECIDDKCHCQYPLSRMYDKALGECVILANSPCDPRGEGPPCIQKSICSLGSCRCISGFSENSDQKCFLNLGQPCQPNQCNVDKGLACKEEVCQCIDSSYIYCGFHGKCVNPAQLLREFTSKIGITLFDQAIDRKTRKLYNGEF